ncbi:hypothetical protein KIN20_029249 [Parelaphostrongylus tenuis]|uniref:Uncharacterized protein n=1 Tax=Parelaphostrongylus tenuis TaxID=148309 RepID=A0AAD5R229_PARTN|nr:hypothetical protein KIN20_029249 [Parelaphostrongylus tenuis]
MGRIPKRRWWTEHSPSDFAPPRKRYVSLTILLSSSQLYECNLMKAINYTIKRLCEESQYGLMTILDEVVRVMSDDRTDDAPLSDRLEEVGSSWVPPSPLGPFSIQGPRKSAIPLAL